jgi:hypothetical protein
MQLTGYKIIFIAIGVIGIIVIASLTFLGSITLPEDRFSEIHLLGPQHTASNFPYNIAPDQSYTLFVDVGNHQTATAYYLVYVKLLNASDPLPTQNSASPSQPIYTYRFLIKQEDTVEQSVDFSISNVSFLNNQTNIGNVHINGVDSAISKSALWNQTRSIFPYILLFELWQYDAQTNAQLYDNRFVSLQLNCTA